MTCQKVLIPILIMIVIPLTLIGIYVAVIINWVNEIPEWFLILMIMGILGLSVFLVLKSIKRWADIPCTVTLSDSGITIELKRSVFFFLRTTYQGSWDMIKGASTNYEPNTSKRFYTVNFKSPAITIYLNAPEKVTPGEETEFGTLLMNYIEQHNQLNSDKAEAGIDTTNFYERPWARIFSLIIMVFMIVVLIIFIMMPEKIDFWRVLQLFAFASIFFTAYYLNRRKKTNR